MNAPRFHMELNGLLGVRRSPHDGDIFIIIAQRGVATPSDIANTLKLRRDKVRQRLRALCAISVVQLEHSPDNCIAKVTLNVSDDAILNLVEFIKEEYKVETSK